jgi:hypothetical protein
VPSIDVVNQKFTQFILAAILLVINEHKYGCQIIMLPSQQRNYQQPPRSLNNRTLFKSRARVPFLDTAMGRFGLLTGLVLAFGSGMLLQRPVHAPTFTLNQKLSQVMQVPALVRAPVATVLPGQKTIVPDSAVLSVASAKAPVASVPVVKTLSLIHI